MIMAQHAVIFPTPTPTHTPTLAAESKQTGVTQNAEMQLSTQTSTSPRVLVVFDFDETISSAHIFHLMAERVKIRQGRGQDLDFDFDTDLEAQQLQSLEEARHEVVALFGGEHRIGRMHDWLESLSLQGAKLAIVSFGFSKVILEALRLVCLDQFFPEELVFGRQQLQSCVSATKAAKVQELAKANQLPPSRILFVDDDARNVQEVGRWPFPGTPAGQRVQLPDAPAGQRVERFRVFHVAEKGGLSENDRRAISQWLHGTVSAGKPLSSVPVGAGAEAWTAPRAPTATAGQATQQQPSSANSSACRPSAADDFEEEEEEENLEEVENCIPGGAPGMPQQPARAPEELSFPTGLRAPVAPAPAPYYAHPSSTPTPARGRARAVPGVCPALAIPAPVCAPVLPPTALRCAPVSPAVTLQLTKEEFAPFVFGKNMQKFGFAFKNEPAPEREPARYPVLVVTPAGAGPCQALQPDMGANGLLPPSNHMSEAVEEALLRLETGYEEIRSGMLPLSLLPPGQSQLEAFLRKSGCRDI